MYTVRKLSPQAPRTPEFQHSQLVELAYLLRRPEYQTNPGSTRFFTWPAEHAGSDPPDRQTPGSTGMGGLRKRDGPPVRRPGARALVDLESGQLFVLGACDEVADSTRRGTSAVADRHVSGQSGK